ncbi:MAG: ATP-dependent helicase [Clostridiaceae bacterium]|nr:ATP-dependent helicase [Clostridiaceae bacterium]
MKYENELERLNPYQKEAVLDESDACVVNANVGSGKTTVLIAKILYLHYGKQISYSDMVVLTFTNKAANEIRERLIHVDNSVISDELCGFGTFHSVALWMLRSVLPVETLGYTKEFQVIEPDEEIDLAMELILREKLNIKYKNRLKKRLEQAMAVQEEEKKVSRYKDDLFILVNLLKMEKIKQNKMSFFDLLFYTTMLLEQSPVGFRWIILDEVQDSDEMQLAFIDRMKQSGARLFAVGDPNQVIYSWRGSVLNVFYTLKKRYHARELSLPINYRSSSSILEAARCFLQTGSGLTGIREPGSKILVKRHYDPFSEAGYLADRIKELHENGISYREIAVFYRLQTQSQILEDVLERNDIPFEVSLKKTIHDIPVLNWVMKVFRYSLNPDDRTSGIYALSNKEYGEHFTVKEAGKIIGEKDRGRSCLLSRMLEFKERCPVCEEVQALYGYFDFDRYIHPTSAAYQEDKKAVCTLMEIILEYVRENKMGFLDGMRDFINSSALYGINILQREINREEDSVKLMTLHASKGLEFSHVFIIGVNYGLIPLRTKSMEEEDEERRLFFVGITRAKDQLELSYYINPGYNRVEPEASSYIRMIPGHLIQEDDGENHEPVNLQEMKRQILELRAGQAVEPAPKTSEPAVPCVNTELSSPNKQVKHRKYGTGAVVREDDMMIEVEFEGYGIKEFVKCFSELEYL